MQDGKLKLQLIAIGLLWPMINQCNSNSRSNPSKTEAAPNIDLGSNNKGNINYQLFMDSCDFLFLSQWKNKIKIMVYWAEEESDSWVMASINFWVLTSSLKHDLVRFNTNSCSCQIYNWNTGGERQGKTPPGNRWFEL